MKILLTGPVSLKFKDKLKTLGDVEYKEVDKTGLSKIIGDYDIIVIRSHTVVDAEMITRAKNLKVIARYGIGIDNIDIEAARKVGIAVVNAPTASVTSVAEHTIMLILSVIRQLPKASMDVIRGNWNRNSIMGMEISGKTVGILGYGHIGRAVADRLRAFGCKVIFYDTAVYDEGWVPLDELLKNADILSIHVPLKEDTYHLIDDEKLSLLQDGAFVVNTARGAIIDETALEKHAERLGGIALDVYETEPVKINSYMKNANIVLTPHIAANTTCARRRLGVELFDRITKALESK